MAVQLRALPEVDVEGEPAVALADVWAASGWPGDVNALTFDFLGDDGFRSSLHGGAGLPGATFAAGYLKLATRRPVWSGEVDCCYRVKGLSMIVACPAAH